MQKFSVLLSVYRREQADYLRQSLDSVFAQTLPPDEVVLVKDGPLTPELDSAIHEYARMYSCLKVVQLPQNVGLGRALNEGLKHCSHDLVARMDTDDIAKPERFEKQIRFMAAHPEIGVCSAWIDEFTGEPDNVVSRRTVPETHEEIWRYGKSRCPVNHPCVVFRKTAVTRSGGYLHFPLYEDYFLWVRMLHNGGVKFHNLQESLLLFRSSQDMFRRRGGWKYAFTEVRFQWAMFRLGYVGFAKVLANIGIRLAVRILPNRLRSLVYKRLLRK